MRDVFRARQFDQDNFLSNKVQSVSSDNPDCDVKTQTHTNFLAEEIIGIQN